MTEGDKVEAQARFGYSVNGFGVGDLASSVSRVSDAEVDRLVAEYDERYTWSRPYSAFESQDDLDPPPAGRRACR